MKFLKFCLILCLTGLLSTSCKENTQGYKTISPESLKDKIAGGWAGKMIGVTYGAPTEFRANGKIYTDSIHWKPSDTWHSMWQDDIYVQLTFLMTMDKYGIDTPAKTYHEMLAKAGYQLWHANMQARKNFFDSIFPPQSGSPEFSLHSDDIDFQIESDYIGFIHPGMPRAALEMAEITGRIMNYGEGLYGGIFVAALYCEAFFENNILKIVETALKSIPEESDYNKIIKDVIKLHSHYPADWQSAWTELENKWGEVDICGAGTDFNIDAKLNGAYIVMGLLYGEGDPLKTLEITTRCGQDSDCNPSNAMAVLGVIKGLSGLPADMQEGVRAAGDSLFVNTTYTFNKAVTSSYNYALEMISRNGGTTDDSIIRIKIQEPFAPAFEDSYPNLLFDHEISIFDTSSWTCKGKWTEYYEISWGDGKPYRQSLYAENPGDEIEVSFKGTGLSLEGNWYRDGGIAEVYVDGKLHRKIDTYYFFADQQHTTSIWHVLNLNPGNHTVKLIVKGEKRPEATGTKLYLTKAIVFNSGPKKSDTARFSFE